MTDEVLPDLKQLSVMFNRTGRDDYLHIAGSVAKHGQSGIDYLFAQYELASHVEQKQACLFALTSAWQIESPSSIDYQQLLALLLKALRSEDATLMASAISDFLRLDESSALDEILQFVSHPDPHVRFLAWRCLVFLEPATPKLTLDPLIGHFRASPPADFEEEYYATVAALIRQQGPVGVEFLFDTYDESANVDQKCAILSVLATDDYCHAIQYAALDATRLAQLFNSALASNNEHLIIEAVDNLRYLGQREKLDQIMGFWAHPSPYVKGCVLRYLAKLFPATAFPILIESCTHPHYIVRENAGDELSEMGLTAEQKMIARPFVEALLQDDHPDVRAAAQWAIDAINDTDE